MKESATLPPSGDVSRTARRDRPGAFWWSSLASLAAGVIAAGVVASTADDEEFARLAIVFLIVVLGILAAGTLGVVSSLRNRAGAAIRGFSFAAVMLVALLTGPAVAAGHRQWCRDTADELALHLEAYRTEHGAYPADLSDLVPGTMDRMPSSPVTRLTGQMLFYSRIGNSYVIRIVTGEWQHECCDENGWLSDDECWEVCW